MLFMKSKISYFILFSGMLLLLTGIAKLIAASGNSMLLYAPDPILRVPFRLIFLIAGLIEIAVALFCFISKSGVFKIILLAWISTNFSIYRIGLILINYQKPCGCLGSMTDILHISPAVADLTTKIILAYLLIGSYGIILTRYIIAEKRQPNFSN